MSDKTFTVKRISTTVNTKFHIKTYTYNIKIKDPLSIIPTLNRVLEECILNDGNDAYKVGLKITSNNLLYPLYIEYRPLSSINSETILMRLDRLTQSNINLDFKAFIITFTYLHH